MPIDVAAGRAQWSASPGRHYRYDDPWCLSTTQPRTGVDSMDPTLFALGNGHLGVRGSVLGETDSPTNVAIVNGFYESWTMSYPESAFGFATAGQTLLTAPSPSEIVVTVDGLTYEWHSSSRTAYERVLSMRDITYTESLVWDHPTAGRVKIVTQRFVSMASDSLIMVRLDVEALDRACNVTAHLVTSDGQQLAVGGDPDDPRRSRNLPPDSVTTVASQLSNSGFSTCVRTAVSGLHLAISSRFATTGILSPIEAGERVMVATVSQSIAPGQGLRIDRASSYQLGAATSRPDGLMTAGCDEAEQFTYEDALAAHLSAVQGLWQRCDIEVDTTPAEQQAIRFAVLQLIQAGALTRSGVAAKGVSSNGYEGHYFWDTEAFMLPFWQHVDVDRARHLLSVRHRQLPIARDRAEQLKHDGALFAWRTINGHEASGYFPAGSAQIHLNADIGLAVARFLTDYPTDRFLVDGVEMLVEIARFFTGYGFVGSDGAFHLHCVTGPDEYTALVDDNYYTNRSAQATLTAAVEHVSRLDPSQLEDLTGRVRLDTSEVDAWSEAASTMYLGYSEDLGIRPQDNSFLSKQRWDFSGGRPKRPLLLDYHPTTIYRRQVLKQSDVVLADFVFGRGEDPGVVRRNFDYYEALTTGDSSLSAGIQGAVACRLGYDDLALAHFHHALWTDLDNLHDNTSDGIHVATAGSIWLCLVRGFAGIASEGGLTIDPRLPESWGAVRLPYLWRGNQLRIEISAEHVEIENFGSDPIEAEVRGASVVVEPGATTRTRL